MYPTFAIAVSLLHTEPQFSQSVLSLDLEC